MILHSTVHNHLTIFCSNFSEWVEGCSSFLIILFYWLWGDTPDPDKWVDDVSLMQLRPISLLVIFISPLKSISPDWNVNLSISGSIACGVLHISGSLFRESFGTISLNLLFTGLALGEIILPGSFTTSLVTILSSVWLELFVICIRLSSLANMALPQVESLWSDPLKWCGIH